MLIFGSKPLLTYAGARETYQAFKKLDFLMVADLFMTPTASLPDVVLPVAANLEYDDLVRRRACLAARPKIEAPPGECRSDMQWINLIAGSLGFGRYFWPDESAALDAIPAPAGLNFDQLKTMGLYCVEQLYRKHEARGFSTHSGKVELFSEALQEMGIDPLPGFVEPKLTPYGFPELTTEYPLVLTSGKNPFYFHASHQQHYKFPQTFAESPSGAASGHRGQTRPQGRGSRAYPPPPPQGKIIQTLRLERSGR